MHPMRLRSVAVGLWLLAASVAAEEAPGVGSWAGTLGGVRVHLCFDRYGGAEMYDLDHWRPRRLVAVDSASEDALLDGLTRGELELWEVEGPRFEPAPPRGRWSLRLQADVWQGEWRDASGGAALPVTLHRLPRAAAAGPECDAAYYRPIAEAVVIRREPASFAGQAYETWSTADAVAMAPLNGAPGAAVLQAAADAWLRERAVFAFQCRAGRQRRRGAGRHAGAGAVDAALAGAARRAAGDLLRRRARRFQHHLPGVGLAAGRPDRRLDLDRRR